MGKIYIVGDRYYFREVILLKIITTIIFILIVSSSTCVGLNQVDNDNNQEELSDLVGSLEIVEINNMHYFYMNISNIGNAPANNLSFTAKAYPYGIFLFRAQVNNFLKDILPPLLYEIFYFPIYMLHINPSNYMGVEVYTPQILSPGKTYTELSMIPIDRYLDFFINMQICIILEIIVDPDNLIKESNEKNNREVIRWWFPLRNEPP